MVWRAYACGGLLLNVRDICQGCEKLREPRVDGERHYAEFWQRHGELLCDPVVDAYVVGYGGPHGEVGLDYGIWLQHRGRKPAGDVEPKSNADADGTVRADEDRISYRETYDQQQFVQEQHKDGVFERNRSGRRGYDSAVVV